MSKPAFEVIFCIQAHVQRQLILVIVKLSDKIIKIPLGIQ